MTLPKQLPVRLTFADYGRNRYFEVIPPGVTLDEVMTGDYWVHVRKRLRVNDVMEVVAADGSFDADLRILSINQASGDIRFRVLRNVAGTPADAAKPVPAERYEAKHKRLGQWHIIEKATGAVVVDGLSKDEAVAEKARLEDVRKAA